MMKDDFRRWCLCSLACLGLGNPLPLQADEPDSVADRLVIALRPQDGAAEKAWETRLGDPAPIPHSWKSPASSGQPARTGSTTAPPERDAGSRSDFSDQGISSYVPVLGESAPFPRNNSQTEPPRTAPPMTRTRNTTSRETLPELSRALWVSNTKSTGGHPIEVARVGRGPIALLIVGSLYGSDPSSIKLLDEICRVARSTTPHERFSVLLVRTGNPDGATGHMRTNSRGVDLNRNFPTPSFTSFPNRQTGPHAASEEETKYLVRILEEFQPARVVHIRSHVGDTPIVWMNEKWATAGKNLYLPENVGVGKFQGTYKSGSLEEYAARELQTAVATIVLPPDGNLHLRAKDVLRFTAANLSSEAVNGDLATKSSGPATQDSSQRSQHGATSSPADGVKGVVELLPPPPVLATTSHTQPPANHKVRSRYFELPPPPH